MLEKFKPIKQLYQLLILVAILIISHYILYEILFLNVANGVYPSESDTVFIAIFGNFISALFIFILSLIAVLIPKTKLIGIISVIALGLACLLTLLSAYEWLTPHHYPIGIAFIVQFLVSVYMLLSSIKLRTLNMQKNTST